MVRIGFTTLVKALGGGGGEGGMEGERERWDREGQKGGG